MGRKHNKFEFHRFYCINCGQMTLELPRPIGHQHEDFHRKVLYCYRCRKEINHIECKNDEDVFDFKEMFAAGAFIEEAKESMAYCE